MYHGNITDTRIKAVTATPTIAPTQFESKVRYRVTSSGVFLWIWNPTGEAWEGCTLRASISSQVPSDIGTPVVPFFVGQKHFATSNSQMYYADGTGYNDWINYGYPGGGGGSGGS